MAQAIEQLDADVFRRLLTSAAPGKEVQINELFARLSPSFIADESDERRQFRASSDTNTIIFSMEATRRLEAHAHAFAAIAIANPLEESASPNDKRETLLAAASAFLTWAVSHDLQHKLRTPDGKARPIESIMSGATDELPSEIFALMDAEDRRYGRNLFLIASSFVMLHELGHLHYRHVRCEDYSSVQQEKEVDAFAAEWLLEPVSSEIAKERLRRINTLFGIAIALLWLTVFTVYLGKHSGQTHPQHYDRLFQVLNQSIEQNDGIEFSMVWELVSCLLFVHIDNVGIEVDPARMGGDLREQASYLIDLISRE